MSAACLLVAAAAAAGPPAPCAQVAGWRPLATAADRDRLRDWREAWTEALETAKAGGKPVGADALFDPDCALDAPLPPLGQYRCRFVKLGGAAVFAPRAWGRCAVGEGGFAKIDGPQRPTGRLFPDGPTRGAFLGTLVLGDETRALRYGRDGARDVAGWVERIGDARWRIVLPGPRFESRLDLIELVPAG